MLGCAHSGTLLLDHLMKFNIVPRNFELLNEMYSSNKHVAGIVLTWNCSAADVIHLFIVYRKGDIVKRPHEFQGCSSQKCSRDGSYRGGVGWVMQGWGGVVM